MLNIFCCMALVIVVTKKVLHYSVSQNSYVGSAVLVSNAHVQQQSMFNDFINKQSAEGGISCRS